MLLLYISHQPHVDRAAEELNFTFYLLSSNLNVNVNSHTWQVEIRMGSTAVQEKKKSVSEGGSV